MSSDKEKLAHLLSDTKKTEEEGEEVLASLPSQAGQTDLQVEYLHAKIDRLKEENEGLKQDREQRKHFSYIIFGFMCIYMLISLVIVYLSGSLYIYLSDSVLIVLLTTSLANVIGVFNFVAKYLFPRHKE